MYKILGGDQKEYGPASAEQIAQWIAEGRANANTQVQAEGSTEWKPLSAFPEFAELLQRGQAAPTPPVPAQAQAAAQEPLPQDYDLQIGDCVSRGWTLVKENFGLLVVTSLVFIIIQFGFGLLSAIPIVGLLMNLASLVVMGPLTAGLYSVFLKRARGEPAEVGGLFAGFSNRFGQLLLAYVVPALSTGLAAVPGLVLLGLGGAFAMKNHGPSNIPLTLAGVILLVIPVVYLALSWAFTLILSWDKGLDFWKAMQTSRAQVARHFFAVLMFLIVIGLIGAAGALLCCVGLFFTLPITFASYIFAYETLFGGRGQPSPVAPR